MRRHGGEQAAGLHHRAPGIAGAALDAQVRRCAAALLSLGLRREERVLLLMHDGLDWPVAFLGTMYAGLVPVAVGTAYQVAASSAMNWRQTTRMPTP